MKTIIIWVLLSFFSMVCFGYSNITDGKTADEKKASKYRDLNISDKERTIKTYKESTHDQNYTNWNTSDWRDYLNKNGSNESAIGNTNILLNKSPGATAIFSANPNQLSTDGLQQDDKYKDMPSIKAWDKSFQTALTTSSTKNSSTNIAVDSTVKCYITRDIPIRYKCSKTKLIYGGDMNANGLEAKKQCEDECYEQHECVSLNFSPYPEVVLDDIDIDTKDNLDNASISREKEISSDNILDTISFHVDINSSDTNLKEPSSIDKYVSLDLSYFDREKENKLLVNTKIFDNNGTITLKIVDTVDKIFLRAKVLTENLKVKVSNIKATYRNEGKFICPSAQDISNDNPGEFAQKCPSGHILNFTLGTKYYTICADYGIYGDNRDGTFSNFDSCNAICKEQFSCNVDLTTMNTEILKDYREGCIKGQTNCNSDDVCSNLRQSGAKVLNENVFDANSKITKTIVNSTQVPGVNRPRVLLSEDLDFIHRSAEEWKDEAYKYMINNNRFNVTNVNLGDDTESSSAYNIGVGGGLDTVGYQGLPKRGLFWILKPKAFDVNTQTNYKFFIVLDVVTIRQRYSDSGNLEKFKDRTLYIKTSQDDDFKPFAKKEKWAQNRLTTVDGIQQYVNSVLDASQWKYESFNTITNSWYSHSSTINAEYFLSEPIVMGEKPYLRFTAVHSLNILNKILPGYIHSIVTDGPNETINYAGTFDGTGDTFSNLRVYAFYVPSSDASPTYGEIVNEIDNETLKPFYENLTPDAYSKYLKNDNGEVKGTINTFLYGAAQNKTSYIQIFPKEDEIGKKGFVFIFAY